MRLRLVLPVLALTLPATAAAQTRFELVPQIGYARFGDLWKGPVGTSIRSADGALYGVLVGVQLAPAIALTGNVAYGRSDLEAGLPILGSAAFGTSETLYFDGGLEVRLPLATATPFLQVGAGGVYQSLEAGGVGTDATSPAFHVGAGIDVPIGRSFALRLQGRDYISRFDAREAVLLDVEPNTGHTLALTAGVALRF